ncbi:hypothetical protein E4U54_005136 [Claviceps lovelessii]|nr:hypothetical protein E4U54_005136 [Claviceps lovelessii]
MSADEQKHDQQHEKTTSSEARGTRVAVIGTGLAGLTTAYLLDHDKQKRFSVTLFEQAKAFSLDAASVTIVHEKTGLRERLDVPPRSFCRGYYTNLCRMYDFLGICLQPFRLTWVFAAASVAAASVTGASEVPGSKGPGSEGPELIPGSYFVYGKGLDALVLLWRHFWSKGIRHIVETLFLILCHGWFYACCLLLVTPRTVHHPQGPDDDDDDAESGLHDVSTCESFDTYLRRIRLPRWYVNRYLLPVLSSVFSCPHAEALNFPASDITGFVRGSFRQKFFVNQDGINRVQAKLSESIQDVRLQTRVLKVEPVDGKVLIRWQRTEDGGTIVEEVFDRVVLAVAPNVAASIFDKARPMLGRIPTVSITSSLLARPSEEISIVQEESDIPAGQCTYRGGLTQTVIFRTSFSADIVESEALHYLPSGVVVKTTSLSAEEKSFKVLDAVRFPRTLRTVESRRITAMITGESSHRSKSTSGSTSGSTSSTATTSSTNSEAWYSGRDNVWVAGSWCWDGLVLLEGCVVSATRVAKDFGVEVPW